MIVRHGATVAADGNGLQLATLLERGTTKKEPHKGENDFRHAATRDSCLAKSNPIQQLVKLSSETTRRELRLALDKIFEPIMLST